jgi:tRNA-dihydrouridine synthase C
MRKNLTINDLQMIVGPMEGVMTPALIMAANRLNLTKCWMTPFLRVSQELYKDSLVRKFVTPFHSPNAKVIVQIMGNEPELMSDTVAQITRLNLADGINLNFGCPSKRVMSGNCGGGALRDIKLMQEIIKTLRNDHAEINLSAKIRLGYNQIDEMEEIIPALIEDDLLDFLVVHCRIVTEGYKKIEGHFARFKRAKELTKELPLIVNGDIATKKQGLDYMQQLNVQGFMCARTWLANPFIFTKETVDTADKELLYSTVIDIAANELNLPYSVGKKIELSNLIFGQNNPYFEELKKQHKQSLE